MTVQEITTLDLTDIDLKEATIKAKGGRKQRARTLNLQAGQILLLHQYIKEDRKKLLKYNKARTQDDERALMLGDNGARIYANTINVIVNTGRKKNERLKPIKIRQSVIAHLLKQNNDLRIVQVFAGHKRAGSTEEYKQTGLEELKTIIQNLHPLEFMERDKIRK
jgi:site-specific recombinase XerD